MDEILNKEMDGEGGDEMSQGYEKELKSDDAEDKQET